MELSIAGKDGLFWQTMVEIPTQFDTLSDTLV